MCGIFFSLLYKETKVFNLDKEKLLLFDFRIICYTTFPWYHWAIGLGWGSLKIVRKIRTTIRRIFQTSHFERNYSGWWAECYFSFKVSFNSCSAQFVRFIGWFSTILVLFQPPKTKLLYKSIFNLLNSAVERWWETL